MQAQNPVGLILCGGRSSRMSGQNKALLDFRGQPLLQRVLGRFASQMDSCLLNIPAADTGYERFGLPLVTDIQPNCGPLMGLASAFQYTGAKANIALCPCDAPFVPLNLVAELIEKMQNENSEIVCPTYRGVLQPTFALWNKSTAARVVEAAVAEAVGGLQALYSEFRLSVLDWPESTPNPFFNINTPADLASALE